MKNDCRSAGRYGVLRLIRDKSGATAPLLAVVLTTLFGFAGLGVDVGIWYTLKRQYQSAADIAALSGAMELATGKATNTGGCTQGATSLSDLQCLAKFAAQNNMTTGSATNLTVASGCTTPPANELCVNNPPLVTASAYYNNPGYVEAILGEPGISIFPGLVGFNNAILIRTRAVAGLFQIKTCMVALNTSGTDLGFNGGGSGVGLQIPNCSFVSDSTTTTPPTPQNQDSIVINGNVTINAAAINTSGNYTITGNSNSVSPPILTGTPYQADPYGGKIGTPAWPWNNSQPNNGCENVTSGIVTLQPGWYGLGGPNCPNGNSTPPVNLAGGTITMCPGVYYVTGEDNKGEGFVISNTGTVVQTGTAGSVSCPNNNSPDGVTIITTCNTGSNCGGGFVIGSSGSSGDPTVILSGPCVSLAVGSSCPNLPTWLQNAPGLLFYQYAGTADTTKGNTILAGSGGANLSGVIYTPSTQIQLQGSPTFGSCLELIAGSYSIGGTPSFNQPPTCNILTDNAQQLVLAE